MKCTVDKNLDNIKNYRVEGDVVDLVVFSDPIETILDVGCDYSYTGEALKNKVTIRVEGLEFMPDACEEAKHLLDHVYQGSAEDTDLISTLGSYECIISADLPEQLIDPWETPTLLRDHLHKNGCWCAASRTSDLVNSE